MLALAAAAITLVAGTVFLAPAAQAVGCGDGSLTFSGGNGSTASPYLISDEDDLEALKDAQDGSSPPTPSYYASSCVYLQTRDITLTRTWGHGIGYQPYSGAARPFHGTYDGGGFSISNLVLVSAAPDEVLHVGLFGSDYSGQATIRNINLVSASVTCSNRTTFAGLLVGELFGSLERSSASGTLACGSSGSASWIGGLIGFTSGSVVNGSVSGTVTLPLVWSPFGAGGAIGKTDSGSSVQNVVSRVTITNPLQAIWAGVAIGVHNGSALASFAQDGLTGGGTTVVGAGSATGLTLKTAAELQDITTYTGWSISAGRDTSTIWGIDPAINGGFPFLQAFPVPVPDPSQFPPPILQQLPVLEDGSCAIQDDAAFGYGTPVHGGWGVSWAQWANGGTGGPVCTRTLVYTMSGWTVET